MLYRLKSLRGACVRAAALVGSHPKTSPALFGLALGVATWSAAHPFVATFGFNREAVAALLVSAVGSFSLGMHLARRRPFDGSHGLPSLFAAGWLVLLPTVITGAEVLAAVASLPLLETTAVRLLVLVAAALVAFGLPSFFAGVSASRLIRRGDGEALTICAGLGVLGNALLLAPALGLQVPLFGVALCVAIVWFARLLRGDRTEMISDSPAAPLTESWRQAVSAALAAIVCGVCGRALAQLTPEGGYLIAAGCAAGLVGAGSGAVAARRLRCRFEGGAFARGIGAVAVAVAVMSPLAAFPWLVERHLDANANVSSVFWLMLLRAGIVAACFFAVGLGCGLMTAGAGRRSSVVVLAAACGLGCSGWLIPAVGIVPLALSVAVLLVAINGSLVSGAIPRTRGGWVTAGAFGTGLVVIALSVGRYEPARAARLLFSTETFVARQQGLPPELLPQLDDARLAHVAERPAGTVTLWKRRGDAYDIRLNGVPFAATSARPDRCPLPTPDVLRAALPLVLHDAPESMLLLGDPAGLATDIAAGFPIREIVCVEPEDEVRGAVTASHDSDPRVSRIAVEPRLAIAAEPRTYDVIVSDPGNPSLPAAAPYLTREFYSRAADRLNAGGIFCQRLRYADFGPAPLRVIAATTRGLFGDTMIIEVGSGEYVLLAAKHESMLVRDGLVERLMRPHARRTFASLGWDWCIPLNLASVEHDGLARLAAEAGGANTASNGRLAYTLPQEVMRWGMKSRELQQATAGLTSRLLVRGVPEADQRDVLDRLAEVTGQHRLMTEYPDQPWAYRKEVRKKLKEAPRSVIQPVAGEVQRVIHPDDRRRLDYFGALGNAVKSPGPDSLAELERFAAPYDPMLTYFLHHEVAPLYSRLGSAGKATELDHRLYAAHFADPRDRSVRNEIAALELIVANPSTVPGDAERFDQLNALIAVLLGRWEARGTAEPRSPEVMLVDIDKTLDAVEAAVDAMAPLAASAGLSDEGWRFREAAIDRTLTRPLRTYRTTLLPHVRAAQRKAAATTAAAN